MNLGYNYDESIIIMNAMKTILAKVIAYYP